MFREEEIVQQRVDLQQTFPIQGHIVPVDCQKPSMPQFVESIAEPPPDVDPELALEILSIDMPALRKFRPDVKDEDLLKPSAIADAYWFLAHQDRSAWSHELDVRPYKEKF